MHHLSLFFVIKPPFIGDFPLRCFITGGYLIFRYIRLLGTRKPDALHVEISAIIEVVPLCLPQEDFNTLWLWPWISFPISVPTSQCRLYAWVSLSAKTLHSNIDPHPKSKRPNISLEKLFQGQGFSRTVLRTGLRGQRPLTINSLKRYIIYMTVQSSNCAVSGCPLLNFWASVAEHHTTLIIVLRFQVVQRQRSATCQVQNSLHKQYFADKTHLRYSTSEVSKITLVQLSLTAESAVQSRSKARHKGMWMLMGGKFGARCQENGLDPGRKMMILFNYIQLEPWPALALL